MSHIFKILKEFKCLKKPQIISLMTLNRNKLVGSDIELIFKLKYDKIKTIDIRNGFWMIRFQVQGFCKVEQYLNLTER